MGGLLDPGRPGDKVFIEPILANDGINLNANHPGA